MFVKVVWKINKILFRFRVKIFFFLLVIVFWEMYIGLIRNFFKLGLVNS